MTQATQELAPIGAIDLSAAITAAAQLGKDGVEVLERLHAIAKDERASQARAAFNGAVASLHAKVGSITKNRTASFATKAGAKVTYRYADLHQIAATLRPHTGPLGLAWRWSTDFTDNMVKVTCIASHREGHSESSTWTAPIEGGNPLTSEAQKGKIATTFAQRVTLIQVFGLTDTEDDLDGVDTHAPRSTGLDGDGEPVPPDTITDEQAAVLRQTWEACPAGEEARCLKSMRLETLGQMPARAYANALKIAKSHMRTAP